MQPSKEYLTQDEGVETMKKLFMLLMVLALAATPLAANAEDAVLTRIENVGRF